MKAKKSSMKKSLLIRFGVVGLFITILLVIIALTNYAITGINDASASINKEANVYYDTALSLDEFKIAALEAITIHDSSTLSQSLNDYELAIYTHDIIVSSGYTGDQFFAYVDEISANVDGLQDLANELMSKNGESARVSYYVDTFAPAVDEVVNSLKAKEADSEARALTAAATMDMITIAAIGSFAVVIAGIFLSCLNILAYINKNIVVPLNVIETNCEKFAKGDLTASFEIQTSSAEMEHLSIVLGQTISDLAKLITEMTEGIEELAKKNFTVRPSMNYQGEFSKIEGSFVNLVEEIAKIINEIKSSATQVTYGSQQVAAGAQALAEGATDQAISLEELSTTIEEISSQVSKTAENAHVANKSGAVAGDVISKSTDEMNQLMLAIQEIKQSSTDIEKIIKTIEDIAFQTNILALNAAVEAARAGQAGKGFAVVADEVRNLAQKSAEAAKNTTDLIKKSLDAVTKGTRLADDTYNAFGEVEENTKLVLDTVAQIALASEKQAKAIEEIHRGISDISAVVQTNSATAEESAAASEELSSRASLMTSLVAEFRTLDEVYSQSPELGAAKPAELPSQHSDQYLLKMNKY